MKLEKHSLIDFYIKPVVNALDNGRIMILQLIGWWYCKDCKKVHAPRVKKFSIRENYIRQYSHDITICSKAVQEREKA